MREIRRALLRWYRAKRRDLPWRRTRDPYAIWISEAMLQQTRVETVIPYYERFLERFPDTRSLASAELDEVLGLWAGLGYYSRARNLRRAAQVVVDEYGGNLPDDIEELRSLPGVGPYTAGALASIAFDRPEPVVDGNVMRVLARIEAIRDDVKKPAVLNRFWELASALAKGRSPGDLNQAIMELGATVCTPRAPRCDECPVRRHCAALEAGDAESLPVKGKKPAPRKIEATAALVYRRGTLLAVKRPPQGLLGGLWDLPGDELASGEAALAGVLRGLRERVGLSVTRAHRVGEVQHAFTHRLLRLHVFQCEEPRGRTKLSGFDAHRWVSRRAMRTLPQGSVTAKALDLALGDCP